MIEKKPYDEHDESAEDIVILKPLN